MNAAVLSWGYDMVYIDNWGIPLWALALTVDASGVAQRSSIGEWHWMHVYWAMWSLFSSTIEQCEVHLTKVKFVQVCNHWTVLLDALYRDEHGCGWGGAHDRWCWWRGSPTPVVQWKRREKLVRCEISSSPVMEFCLIINDINLDSVHWTLHWASFKIKLLIICDRITFGCDELIRSFDWLYHNSKCAKVLGKGDKILTKVDFHKCSLNPQLSVTENIQVQCKERLLCNVLLLMRFVCM